MKYYAIKDLKVFRSFLDEIRWDVTPKIFMEPRFAAKDGGTTEIDITGYFFYVDLVLDEPTLVIMQNTPALSITVGYIQDVPRDLLDEAVQCAGEECQAGMYPLTKKLEAWLKKELEGP